jgi:uncharacterized protein YwqG
MLDLQTVHNLIDAAGLPQIAAEIKQSLKTSVRLVSQRVQDESSIPIGASKIGGQPDLPSHQQWVYWDDKPLTFIAQINLSEIHPYGIDQLLPATGMLYFFYYTVDYWMYLENPLSWRVLYHQVDGSPLERKSCPPDPSPRPEEWEWSKSFAPCSLTYVQEFTIPQYFIGDAKLTDTERETYNKLRLNLLSIKDREVNRMYGYAEHAQDPPQWDCEYTSSKTVIPENEIMPRYRQSFEDWVLLLQIDGDKADMMWDDGGKIFFCIRKEDLQQRRFDKVWLSFQSY